MSEVKEAYCKCSGWKKNIPIIDELMFTPYNISHMPNRFNGEVVKQFSFCPYCGKKVKKRREEDE